MYPNTAAAATTHTRPPTPRRHLTSPTPNTASTTGTAASAHPGNDSPIVNDTSAYPIFTAFHNHGNIPFKLLVRNILNLLLPEPLLRIDAPSSTEATMTRQKGRSIVHILQYAPQRRTQKLDLLEDIVPIFDVPLSVKLTKAPAEIEAVICTVCGVGGSV